MKAIMIEADGCMDRAEVPPCSVPCMLACIHRVITGRYEGTGARGETLADFSPLSSRFRSPTQPPSITVMLARILPVNIAISLTALRHSAGQVGSQRLVVS